MFNIVIDNYAILNTIIIFYNDIYVNSNLISLNQLKNINGDWGLGIGDWGLGPIPNPQSPIPNPQ